MISVIRARRDNLPRRRAKREPSQRINRGVLIKRALTQPSIEGAETRDTFVRDQKQGCALVDVGKMVVSPAIIFGGLHLASLAKIAGLGCEPRRLRPTSSRAD